MTGESPILKGKSGTRGTRRAQRATAASGHPPVLRSHGAVRVASADRSAHDAAVAAAAAVLVAGAERGLRAEPGWSWRYARAFLLAP